uniref:Uncharacterized protein n=1 Tax=Chromera velia CCMP2878 TaxID=1169474 RepID=A0A0G4GF95_9ALVE|eukprot:Cvel_21618.t1-p1 / transcript=Cvel_21618.t1 / gene=Cvel_21618 / organism=Chromera_velia_CCMP2878 / gene_product=hypothetical protein / transcript_product=hypothetical protein / location=Cvel_scaffold2043:2252-2755(-) / protein_length=168 / sequence_SO=supercontig / SO=protein_coding / is_pseudo=false
MRLPEEILCHGSLGRDQESLESACSRELVSQFVLENPVDLQAEGACEQGSGQGSEGCLAPAFCGPSRRSYPGPQPLLRCRPLVLRLPLLLPMYPTRLLLLLFLPMPSVVFVRDVSIRSFFEPVADKQAKLQKEAEREQKKRESRWRHRRDGTRKGDSGRGLLGNQRNS